MVDYSNKSREELLQLVNYYMSEYVLLCNSTIPELKREILRWKTMYRNSQKRYFELYEKSCGGEFRC